MKLRKSILNLSAVFSIIFFTWFIFSFFNKTSKAVPPDPFFVGFAWSENIGWISFNSKNCDPDANGISNGTLGCPPAGEPIAAYDISLAPNGNLYGYAWSGGNVTPGLKNIGWIRFDPPGPYPALPNQSVNITFSGTASGFARAEANNAEWDGWIKFSSGGNYGSGVTFGGADGCTLVGYAWGSDIIGWISMSGTAQNGSPYGVKVACGTLSNLQINAVTDPAACSATPQPAVSWTFLDGYNQPNQSAYQVQISTVSNFSSLIHDSGQIFSSANSYIVPSGILTYGSSYYYRVRGWDSSNLPSPFTASSLTSTPGHQGPLVDFYTVPMTAQQGTTTTFIATATAFGGASISPSAYLWSFPSGTTLLTPPAVNQSENVILRTLNNAISLSVTDSDGLACSVSKSIKAVKPLIEYKEIKPQ